MQNSGLLIGTPGLATVYVYWISDEALWWNPDTEEPEAYDADNILPYCEQLLADSGRGHYPVIPPSGLPAGTWNFFAWALNEDRVGAVPAPNVAATEEAPDVDTLFGQGQVEVLGAGEVFSLASVAAAVWAYASRRLTMTAAEVTAAVAGSDLTIRRGDNWVAALTGLGSVVGATKIWFTAKGDLDDLDTAAVIQIDLTGLLRLNGAAGTLADGSITIDSAAAGNLTLRLKPAATKLLEAWDGLFYDVQVLTAAGAIETRTAGALTVEADVTLAVS